MFAAKSFYVCLKVNVKWRELTMEAHQYCRFNLYIHQWLLQQISVCVYKVILATNNLMSVPKKSDLGHYNSGLDHLRNDHSHLKNYPIHHKGGLDHKQTDIVHWRSDHIHFKS